MTNLSSLSKALFAVTAAAVSIVALNVARLVLGSSFEMWGISFEVVAITLFLGFAAWSLRQIAGSIRRVSEVCVQAFRGNLEPRILGQRDAGDLGILEKSVNDVLDIVDAYVRETSASMEYVSHDKCFRKVLTRGLPGTFKNGAIVINAATDVMDQRVRKLAKLAEEFGGMMDVVANSLSDAASKLGEDAQTMLIGAKRPAANRTRLLRHPSRRQAMCRRSRALRKSCPPRSRRSVARW